MRSLLLLLILCGFVVLATAAIVILILATRRQARRCPYCGERVEENASICSSCGRDLAGTRVDRSTAGSAPVPEAGVPLSDQETEPLDRPPEHEREHDDEPAPRDDPGEPDA